MDNVIDLHPSGRVIEKQPEVLDVSGWAPPLANPCHAQYRRGFYQKVGMNGIDLNKITKPGIKWLLKCGDCGMATET